MSRLTIALTLAAVAALLRVWYDWHLRQRTRERLAAVMTASAAAMCAACASASDGACTVGMPISRSSVRASSIISRVSRDVIVAFEYAVA